MIALHGVCSDGLLTLSLALDLHMQVQVCVPLNLFYRDESYKLSSVGFPGLAVHRHAPAGGEWKTMHAAMTITAFSLHRIFASRPNSSIW